MKKATVFLIALIALTLTGCLDTVEEITITPGGTGVYKNTMDMSGMFDVMEMMSAMDTSAHGETKKLVDKDIDSVLMMRSFADTASGITEEQKKLYQDAEMHITMSQKEKIFKMEMTFPFKETGDVQKIIELNNSDKSPGLFGRGSGSDNPLAAMGGSNKEGFPSLNKYCDITIKNGLIKRTPNEEKLATLKDDEKFNEMKGAESMMRSVTFKTIIRLPKPATVTKGENIEVSDDKKTITINSSLMDLFESPQSLAYTIEY